MAQQEPPPPLPDPPLHAIDMKSASCLKFGCKWPEEKAKQYLKAQSHLPINDNSEADFFF